MLVAIDRDLGRIVLPQLSRMVSRPGAAVRRAVDGEFGIVVAKQQRAIWSDGCGGQDGGTLLGYRTIWASISHNERVDAGAQYQAQQVFAGGGTPTAPSATVYFNAIAIANGTLTKTKTDQSLGSASSGVTTNEYTTIGLTRVTGTTPVTGDYTAPSSLGGTFSQVVKKTFTASGSGTAYGAGLFNSTTASGSILYIEDNFSSTAVLVSSDTLACTITISN